MWRNARVGFVYLMLLLLPALAQAQLSGKYSDGQFTADFSDAAGGAFTGAFSLGGQQYPATAHAGGTGFAGNFTAGGNSFAFTATLDGDTLALTTGGKTYTLKRIDAPQNPLAAPPPANPLAAAPADSSKTPTDAPPGYTVLASSDAGRSLITQKPQATSINDALKAAFPELAQYFGDRPEIGKAYEDAKNHKSGGATFSAKWNNLPVKGFVSCKLNDGGGVTVAVLFAREDASKSDFEKLASPAAPAAQPTPANAPDDSTKLLGTDAQVDQFSDGTGSITLPPGWKTQAQTAIDPIFITGPKDQNISIGNTLIVQTPDSPLIKQIAQNQAMMQRLGRNPPPPPQMFVAQFTDPLQAMQDLAPQVSKVVQSHGGPASKIDKILSHKDLDCSLKGGKAAAVAYLVTRTQNGKPAQYRVSALIQIAPINGGTWMYTFTGLVAPVDQFEQDRPLMQAIMNSLKINAQAASQKISERSRQNSAMLKQQADAQNAALQRSHDQFMQDQNQRFATAQAQHQAQEEGYQQHNDQFNAYELQRSRNSADFIETIKGTRTIYDTQTGATGTADLNYSTAVVNQLNQAALDPNRFVEIPLRDELYPLPAGNGK